MVGKVEFKLHGAKEFERLLKDLGPVPAGRLGQNATLAGARVVAAMARQLARKIAEFQPDWLDEPGGLERLDRLNAMLDREHRAVLALARSMRLTHQSQYAAQKASTLARQQPDGDARKPWDLHR